MTRSHRGDLSSSAIVKFIFPEFPAERHVRASWPAAVVLEVTWGGLGGAKFSNQGRETYRPRGADTEPRRRQQTRSAFVSI